MELASRKGASFSSIIIFILHIWILSYHLIPKCFGVDWVETGNNFGEGKFVIREPRALARNYSNLILLLLLLT